MVEGQVRFETQRSKDNTVLTDGDATVRPGQVDVRLRDGGHSDVVVGPGQEGSEGAGKRHCAVSRGTANRHAHLNNHIIKLVLCFTDPGGAGGGGHIRHVHMDVVG